MSMLNYFKVVITAQFFYAVGITMLLYALSLAPAGVGNNTGIGIFQGLPNTDVKKLQAQTEGTLSNQTGFPQATVGSLILFSGIFLVDLLGNFVLAVPSMVNIFLQVIFMFIPIDAQLRGPIVIFLVGIVALIYLLGIIALFTSVTTGRTVV